MTNFCHFARLMLMLLCLANVLQGCSTAARRGTTGDKIQAELDQNNYSNRNKISTTAPATIANAIKPKFSSISTNKTFSLPETKFDITAIDTEAKEFFLGLVDGTEFNLLVSPKITGKISLKLKAVTIADTLDMIQQSYGYGIDINGYNIKVSPAELQTKTFNVNYLDMTRGGRSTTKISSSGIDSSSNTATTSSSGTAGSNGSSNNTGITNSSITTDSNADLWGKLKETIESIIGTEGGRKVAVSPMTGMVIVQAMPLELFKVEKFLQESEAFLNRQVILEAKVLEVELADAYRAGINWGLLSKHLNISQLGGNIAGTDSTNINITPTVTSGSINTAGNPGTINLDTDHAAPVVGQIAQPFGGILTLGLNYRSLASFVELLSGQGTVQVLSNPRISTANNQKAIIKVGTDQFFITNITNTSTTTGNNVVNMPSYEFDSFFSGIALDVTPQINEDGFITLHIHPTVSIVSSDNIGVTLAQGGNTQTQTFPMAKSSIRESDSIVRAKDGQFVVIGGLMQDKTAEIVTGVPLLKDIPFVGTVFRQTRQQANKTELVILLRPMIVNDQVSNKDLAQTKKRFKQLDQGFHVGGGADLYGNLAETKGL